MSEKRPPATKSQAHRFGFVACPGCNPNGLPSGEIAKEIQCAWCWSSKDEPPTHRRFVLREVAEKWAKEHGLSEDDIPTSPESREALQNPPKLDSGMHIDLTPDTDPAPPYVPPLKREEPDE